MTKNRQPRQRTNSMGDYFLLTIIVIVSILFFASSKIWSWKMEKLIKSMEGLWKILKIYFLQLLIVFL